MCKCIFALCLAMYTVSYRRTYFKWKQMMCSTTQSSVAPLRFMIYVTGYLSDGVVIRVTGSSVPSPVRPGDSLTIRGGRRSASDDGS